MTDAIVQRYVAALAPLGTQWGVFDLHCNHFCFGLHYRAEDAAERAAQNMNKVYSGILAAKSALNSRYGRTAVDDPIGGRDRDARDGRTGL